MNIKDVKNAFKIADVKLIQIDEKLKFEYLDNIIDDNGNELPKSFLKENVARVYFLVVDGEIYKIGGSQDKGGIKGTLNIYQDGGVKGRPSIRSYGIWYLLNDTIKKGHKIEIYMMYMPNYSAQVKGLFGYNNIENASLSFKLLEESCLNDYKKIEGTYPKWNFQEKSEPWDAGIQINHAKLLEKSAKNSSINKNK